MNAKQNKWLSLREFFRANLRPFLAGAMGCALVASVAFSAYLLGWHQSATTRPATPFPPELLHASSSTHGTTNLAVATGRVSEEADGVFFLDYTTGNLQCWVYYPRWQAFGAKFETNIWAQLPGGKNAEYLLVTGDTSSDVATSTNAKPAGCMAYVVDVKSGTFASYSMPFFRGAESSGQMQMGQLIFVGGGQFRNPMAGGNKKPVPPAVKEPVKGAAKNAPEAGNKEDQPQMQKARQQTRKPRPIMPTSSAKLNPRST